MNPGIHRVVLDTDIGTDVDDLMALAVLLGTPEVDLIGVTTVYGDTALRARIARRVLGMAGRDDTPVHAGSRDTMSGRDIWWAGHEGALYPNLDSESYDSDDAIEFLTRTVATSPGEIDVIAIGPLTNIAAAILADPGFVPAVRHLWIMGGSFGDDEQEHNFRSDDVAARVVFGSGIPTTVTGLEITRRIRIEQQELDRIEAAGEIGRLIHAEIQQWWAFWNEKWNVPHDPVTVLTLTDPGLFETAQPGVISISTGEREGISTYAPGGGRARVVATLDAPAVTSAIIERIEACGTGRLADDHG